MTPAGPPRISVVTPFFNSVSTLDECIRSVRAQTHADFEYVLADNCSTDGSSDIAREHASRDPRIRYLYFSEHISKTRNYNRALRAMPAAATYCKVVQADDAIYPECLERMLQLGLAHPSVGVISARRMIDDVVDPPESLELPAVTDGRTMARRTLNNEIYAIGSPTTVMYRADLVRARPDFYDEAQYLHDVDTVLELLRYSDFGFCPQVLSFTRRDPASTYGSVTSFYPALLNQYVALRLRGPQFFDAAEAAKLLGDTTRTYYETMARAALRPDRAPLFRFHAKQLRDAALGWEYRSALRAATVVTLRAVRTRLRAALRLVSG